MRIDTLMNLLPSNYTPADRELVKRAYRVAEQAHREQKRACLVSLTYQSLHHRGWNIGRDARPALRSGCWVAA
jgi:hypothetical protein